MKKILSILCVSLLAVSCTKSDNNDTKGGDSDALHLSFYTPDWDAYINCEHLVLDATASSLLTATSASTREQFYLTVPQDSSVMSDASNIKKYGIDGDEVFTFNQSLPITEGSETRLIGVPGLSDNSYNEIVSITYDHSDEEGAYFKLKANYKMNMKPILNPDSDTVKEVHGTYHFLIKTNRK